METRNLTLENYKELTQLMDISQESLPNPEWLRKNTPNMIIECLHSRSPHTVVGTYHNGELIAVGILYDGTTTKENLKTYLSNTPETLAAAINLKIVICHPDHQKQGHIQTILNKLEEIASQQNKTELLTTIHPGNTPSMNLFTKQGYTYIKTAETTYGPRNIYTKQLT